MSNVVEVARAVLWQMVVNSILQGVQDVCNEKDVLYKKAKLSDDRLQQINDQSRLRAEAVIAAMKPDVDAIPKENLGYPDKMGVCLAEIFVKHFRARMEEEAKDSDGPFRDLNVDALIASCVERSQQGYDTVAKTNEAVEKAINTEDYARAEQIIRGSLAVNPDDIGMLNHLFMLALWSGNVELLLEVRCMAKDHPGFGMAPEMVGTEAVTCFLHKAVAENILVAASPLMQPGLIVDGKRLSGSQTENLTKVVEEMVKQAAENVIKELVATDAWTSEDFVNMCRRAIVARTRVYEEWMPGTKFRVQWKGEKLPPWMAKRLQVAT